MKELAPNIFYIPGDNESRFPYCACLYLKGTNLRVLIDAGMGTRNLAPIKDMGIDLLLLTHCHIDHRLNCHEISSIPVWCHTSDAGYLKDREYFLESMGFKRSGLDLTGLFDFAKKAFSIKTDHRISHGERIDLGGITLEAIHTPGHTPGHTAFFIPEHGIIFSGDIDLTPSGPFYGHDFADIDDFLISIDRLSQIPAKMVASGHAGPFRDNLAERFKAYGEVIYSRDGLLLENLNQPKSIKDFEGSHLFYKTYPDFPDLIRWFELVHIEKHFERLKSLGKVRQEGGRWIKI